MSVKVRIRSNLSTRWTARTAKELDATAIQMATDVHRFATVLAPKDKRNLVNSGKIEKEGEADYKVTFGGGTVPYAKIRHFINKLNPHTLKYLERAGKAVARNKRKYLGGERPTYR